MERVTSKIKIRIFVAAGNREPSDADGLRREGYPLVGSDNQPLRLESETTNRRGLRAR
jgi:hypothetical protein